jgi:hypothetical protein
VFPTGEETRSQERIRSVFSALLCIEKSQRQANELPGGMWQMGHTVLGNAD